MNAPAVETHLFADDGIVPNNPTLPLILYRGALPAAPDRAAAFEGMFARNGWPGAWRNGIYGHHHYHSTAHEALGIAAGSARVRVGGEGGASVELRAGDVVVIPAGVAHKREAASADLLVVGAYPRGQDPDMCNAGTADLDRARRNVAAVPLPAADPVIGGEGPLVQRWREAVGACGRA
ncbi:MAG TPA: cupin domain-containing protein [Stellaceae bacterium]|nr:cupin domain-containing protein [Stellaceae bacterium]